MPMLLSCVHTSLPSCHIRGHRDHQLLTAAVFSDAVLSIYLAAAAWCNWGVLIRYKNPKPYKSDTNLPESATRGFSVKSA